MAGIDSDLIRGHIDTIILKSLFEGDKYGLEIIQEIEEKSNGSYELKQPTLYSCLKRLENQGLISSYWEDSEIGGKRHYYTLTDLGKEEYQNNQKEWLRSKEIIDNLIYNDSANNTTEELPIVDQLAEENGEDNNEENSIDDISNNEDVDSSIENLNNDNIDEQEANLLNSINSSDFEQVDDTSLMTESIDDLQNESLILEDYQDDNYIDNLDNSNKENLESEESQAFNDFENSSEDFQFSNFDEIESTAFGTFFETNNEIASSDELDDEFDEPIENNSNNGNSVVNIEEFDNYSNDFEAEQSETTAPLTLNADSISDNDEQLDIQDDNEATQEYVSLIDFLAKEADESNDKNEIEIIEETSEDDEVKSSALIEEDKQPETEVVDDEIETTENSELEDIDNNQFNNKVIDEENSTDDDENQAINYSDEQLEIISTEENVELDDTLAIENDEKLLEEDNQEIYSSPDDEMLLGEPDQEDIYALTDVEDKVLSDEEIYSVADEDEIYNPDILDDDQIYSPIPEDEQIYVPQTDEEETSVILDNVDEMETSADDSQLDDEESSDDADSLYLFDNEVSDSQDKTNEVTTPTYINFGTHTYEEADITKSQDELDLYNLEDNSENINFEENNESNSLYNLSENTYTASEQNSDDNQEVVNEPQQPIYRASQEEIESLYKTTENYENLQAGYTDETYKQMLNELENYGSTTEEENSQRPVAKTYDELSKSFEKEGIEIRKYEKQQKESDDTKIYIKTHQIHMVKNWITFAIATFAIILTFLIMNAFKENYTYPFSFAPFAIAIGVSALFPLYSTILYFANPYKKVVAKYAPRLSILLSVMINIQLILIIYCLNLQLGFYSFAQENYNHLMWILPLILSFIPTIQSIIYYPLYMSKNYHT